MNVNFHEIKAYAESKNIDFQQAAKELGLNPAEARALEQLGGDPGAPVDGFEKKETKAEEKTPEENKPKKNLKEALTLGAMVVGATTAIGGLVGGAIGAFGGGVGALPGAAGGAKLGAIAGALLTGSSMLTSCGDETTIVNSESNNSIEQHIIFPDDQKALIEAMKHGFDALLEEMKKLGFTMAEYGEQIIDLLTENNSYLKDIKEDVAKTTKDNAKIIEILTNIKNTAETIETLIDATNENIMINDANLRGQLKEILDAIKNGETNTMNVLNTKLDALAKLLYDVIEKQGDQIEINKNNNAGIKNINDILVKIYEMQNDSNMATDVKLKNILELLGSIKSIGQDISGKLDGILGELEKQFADNQEIKSLLHKINNNTELNGEKADVTNDLLAKLLEATKNNHIDENVLTDILKAVNKNGDKIDVTNDLVTKLLNEVRNGMLTQQDLQKVIDTINKNGNKIDVTNDLVTKLLNEVRNGMLTQQDLQKVIDTINKNGNKIDVTNELVSNLLNEVKNGMLTQQDLQKVIDTINRNGNKIDVTNNLLCNLLNEVRNGMITQQDLQKVIDTINRNGSKIDVTNELISNLINEVKEGKITQQDLQKVIDAINRNGGKIDATNDLINKVLDEMNKGGLSETDLQKIIDTINKNGYKVDVTNSLLEKLLAQKEDNYISKDDIKAVIDAINQNGSKIDITNNILTEIQNKQLGDGDLQGILDAINNMDANNTRMLGNILNTLQNMNADMKNGFENVINKVLANMDGNTAKVLEAISKIKVEGGGGNITVDTSTIEAMLKELIDTVRNGNNTLTRIEAKMDTLNATAEAIKVEIQKFRGDAGKNFDILMNDIKKLVNKQPEKYDDTKVLEILATINKNVEKLGDLIKDHEVHVTVDVTGKVKCECDCGKPHEGVLDDLEDILG